MAMNMKTLKKILKKTDLITHTRCLGKVEEHYFDGFENNFICGKATKETKKYDGSKKVNDIHINNVTHINRLPIDIVLTDPINCNQCIVNRVCKNTKRVDNAFAGLDCVLLRRGCY